MVGGGAEGKFLWTMAATVPAVARAASHARSARKPGTRKVKRVRGTTTNKRLRINPTVRRVVRAGQGFWAMRLAVHWETASTDARALGETLGKA